MPFHSVFEFRYGSSVGRVNEVRVWEVLHNIVPTGICASSIFALPGGSPARGEACSAARRYSRCPAGRSGGTCTAQRRRACGQINGRSAIYHFTSHDITVDLCWPKGYHIPRSLYPVWGKEGTMFLSSTLKWADFEPTTSNVEAK